MNIKFCTSFPAADKVGQLVEERFRNSWIEHNLNHELRVCYDGGAVGNSFMSAGGVDFFSTDEDPDRVAFLNKYASLPVASGKIKDDEDSRGYRYEFRYQAVRFCHKVFAQTYRVPLCDWWVWLDGDVEFIKSFDEKFFADVLRDDKLWVILDRDTIPETGFVAWRASHPVVRASLDMYRQIYTSGELFTYPQWDDCYALNKIIKEKFSEWSFAIHDLCADLPESKVGDHPWPNTALGEYMIHHKGPGGKTSSEDNSQFKDADIIDRLLEKAGVSDPGVCFEVGAGDGLYLSNTARLIMDRGWKGIFVESDPEKAAQIPANYEDYNIESHTASVTIDNINEFVPDNVDFISIDVDGNDYHIWKALKAKPSLVCIESNHKLPEGVLPDYDPEYSRHTDPRGSWAFGASSDVLQSLGVELGYTFVECDVLPSGEPGPNLFFLRNDLVDDDVLISKKGDFFWPEYDTRGQRFVEAAVKNVDSIYLSHLESFRTCVQAGGNVGVYPVHLSKRFEKVITFEPDLLNFKCLSKNVEGIDNIDINYAALGYEEGSCAPFRYAGRDKINCAATTVSLGGDTPMITLDSLDIQDVDFIFLDVQGWEYPALKGAEATIKRCKPLISVEMSGWGERHGFSEPEMAAWLGDLGYRVLCKSGQDVIFRHGDK